MFSRATLLPSLLIVLLSYSIQNPIRPPQQTVHKLSHHQKLILTSSYHGTPPPSQPLNPSGLLIVRGIDSGTICPHTGISSPHQTMNFTTITRTAIRSALIQQGPQTCSDLVRGMGLDPKRHKGTIHAIMVDLEREGFLGATMKGTRRDLWFAHTDRIRKRDRIIAALIG